MKPSHKLLDIPLYETTKSQLNHLFDEAFAGPKCLHIATINPEFFVEAHTNAKFRTLLQKTINIVDGFGIQCMIKLLQRSSISRIQGVELAEKACAYAAQKKRSVFFLGGYKVAGNAVEIMKQKYPELIIAGSLDGDPHTLQEVAVTKPDIILVAFGAPKQEFWIEKNKDKIPSLRLAIGVGGTFDFWTGKVPRAPQWMRDIGLEWLYRLIKQPSRWRRILNAVVVFPWLCVRGTNVRHCEE